MGVCVCVCVSHRESSSINALNVLLVLLVLWNYVSLTLLAMEKGDKGSTLTRMGVSG